jgi:hypothetical protein
MVHNSSLCLMSNLSCPCNWGGRNALKEIGFEKDTVLSYFNKHNMDMKMHMLLTSNPFAFSTLSMARVNRRPPVHEPRWMVHWWISLFHPFVNQAGEHRLTFFSLAQPWSHFGGGGFELPPPPPLPTHL